MIRRQLPISCYEAYKRVHGCVWQRMIFAKVRAGLAKAGGQGDGRSRPSDPGSGAPSGILEESFQSRSNNAFRSDGLVPLKTSPVDLLYFHLRAPPQQWILAACITPLITTFDRRYRLERLRRDGVWIKCILELSCDHPRFCFTFFL